MMLQDNQNTSEKDVSVSNSETMQEPLSTSKPTPHKMSGTKHHIPRRDRIRASLWVWGVFSSVLVLIAYIFLYKRGILPPWLGDLASSISSVNGLIGGVISGGLVALVLGKTSGSSIRSTLNNAYKFRSLILGALTVIILIAIPLYYYNNGLDPYIRQGRLDNNSLNFSAYSWLDAGANCSQSDPFNISGTTTGFDGQCFAQDTDYSNFIFQVTMQIVSGKCGGILLRADSSSGSEYLFSICTDEYHIYRFDKFGPHTRDMGGGKSQYIRPLGASNLIAVLAEGSKFVLYINGNPIDDVQDSTYTEGKIGLAAYSQTGSAIVVFSDPKVWSLS